MKAVKWKNEIVPNVVLKLNLAIEEGRYCHLMVASNDEYQVRDKNVHYIVNLDKRTCDCGVWDLTGIPCKHAAVGSMYRRQKLEEYTHPSYSKDMYMRAYNHVTHPITHHQFWPENLGVNPTNLGPPPYKRLPGRPKKSRNRENGEGGSKKRSCALKCKRCGGWGHNIRTCKGIKALATGHASQVYADLGAQENEIYASQNQASIDPSMQVETEEPIIQMLERIRKLKKNIISNSQSSTTTKSKRSMINNNEILSGVAPKATKKTKLLVEPSDVESHGSPTTGPLVSKAKAKDKVIADPQVVPKKSAPKSRATKSIVLEKVPPNSKTRQKSKDKTLAAAGHTRFKPPVQMLHESANQLNRSAVDSVLQKKRSTTAAAGQTKFKPLVQVLHESASQSNRSAANSILWKK